MLRLVKSDATSLSEAPPRLQRSQGAAHVAFKLRGADTVLADLYQSGCAKIRLPRNRDGGLCEAVLINTAGGLTDGDCFSVSGHWGQQAQAVITTQACERIYRSRALPANVDNELTVEDGALACWLPQETILFDGGVLRRTMVARLFGNARLIACEAVILGRTAMGERVNAGGLFDAWRIERDDRLAFCDRLSLDGDLQAKLGRPATGAGACAFATLIYSGKDSDLMRDRLHTALGDRQIGCTDLGGVMLARMLAPTGHELRRMLMDALSVMLHACRMQQPAGLPRVWMV